MEKLLKEDTQGEFVVQGMLGRGGMAVVFLATETKLGRKVAIKVLPPELTFGHGVDRFLREAKTAALLDHPNIIPIYRISSGGKLFWYAMKYLEGRSLEDLLKEKGKLSAEESVHILEQVADALDYAHQHNVIHRDMKPANVMLDSRNRVIVTDFGIAKALTEQTLTASGSVVGTPYYMSPEQGMGIGVSGRSDQYSVAVMTFRMLAGQVPFEGDSAIDILHKHCMVDPPQLESLQPGLPANVYQAVHKALAKSQEERFSSMAAFVDALRGPTAELMASGAMSSDSATVVVSPAAARPGVAGPSARSAAVRPGTAPSAPAARRAPAPAPTPQPEVKSKRGLVLGGIGAVAVLAVVGWLVFGRGGSSPTSSQASGAAPQAPPGQQPGGARGQPAGGATSPAATTGHVTVADAPAGAKVAVDGQAQSGLESDLAPGPHDIAVTAPDYEPFSTPVVVVAGQQHTVTFAGRRRAVAVRPPARTPVPQAPRSSVTARTQPTQPPAERPQPGGQLAVLRMRIQPWANLTLNGRSLGQRSQLVDTLIPGTALLRLEREGFFTLDTTLTLVAGDNPPIMVRMKPRSP
jgi:predicted Ser/Thr protein kinase